jgi:hypothetical protein
MLNVVMPSVAAPSLKLSAVYQERSLRVNEFCLLGHFEQKVFLKMPEAPIDQDNLEYCLKVYLRSRFYNKKRSGPKVIKLFTSIIGNCDIRSYTNYSVLNETR